MEAEPIDALEKRSVLAPDVRKAFTLVELLVVIGILSILAAITVPVIGLARTKALELRGMSHLKSIAMPLNAFANDNEDRYPPSMGAVGFGPAWNWHDPRKLVAVNERVPGLHRSVSAYLREYIDDAKVLSCPGAPGGCSYLQQMWDAGDAWDNPATPATTRDLFTGAFCLYWNYEGLLDLQTKRLFRGPWGPACGKSYSRLVACDHFGYGNGMDIPPSYSYASCEPFDGATVNAKADIPRWVSVAPGPAGVPPPAETHPKVSLKAVFTDGHVERYGASEVVPMWVIVNRASLTPYKIDGTQGTPGLFFLPASAVSTR
ncbi:MAG: type II secretion system protein [Sedimentisphaerales bacterium]|nr:type II secretion system protein [Sedimentisphaerales bacterium]